MVVGAQGVRVGATAATLALAILTGGCRSAVPLVAPLPAPDVGRADATAVGPVPLPPPVALPADAFRKGWMPLRATGVPRFLRDHPASDGRGVLIAILDGGVDPGVAGLQGTSTGAPKLVDVRDFSGEGRIRLAPVQLRGDSLVVEGRRLGGAGRVRALAVSGAWYGGVLAEARLGEPPAADVNANGRTTDSLPVVVVRTTGGWALLADTDEDGSLDGERPVHDYLVAREWFGWSRGTEAARLAVAVNLADSAGRPVLDLCFDTSGHGTHVAGIAAGHDLHGVAGFDGVAPGAQLLGLKIANDAHGGISTTGAIASATAYAIAFAAARDLPLVINLSFGVGNEIEGTARIDAVLDSVLALHPDVVMTVSAGNDGPGTSTVGFPGSATRIISVGALLPGVFLAGESGPPPPDVVAEFSARGGEVAGPQLVAPGVAYSAVPRWKQGEERQGGTSMAAPHVAGLVALLRSAAMADGLAPVAHLVRQALMVTAVPLPGSSVTDQGTGVPDVSRAWAWLRSRPALPELWSRSAEPSGLGGAVYVVSRGDPAVRVELDLLRRGAAGPPLPLTLRASAPWLVAPRSVLLTGDSLRLAVEARTSRLARGVHVASLAAWTADTTLGPVARFPVTIVVPFEGSFELPPTLVPAGAAWRIPIRARAGRALDIEVSGDAGSGATAYLHEPGGRPFRAGHAESVGTDDAAASFPVEGNDVEAGIYELVVQASPQVPIRARVAVAQAPVTAELVVEGDAARVSLHNLGDEPVAASLLASVMGAERRDVVDGRGSDVRTLVLEPPAWARLVVVELRMDRALWSRFTDFGVTLTDSAGRHLGTEPLNYAVGQLEHQLDAAAPAGSLRLVLLPGLADRDAVDRWRVEVTTQYYSEQDVPIALEASRQLWIAPRGDAGTGLSLPATLPRLAPPLARLVILGVETESGTFMYRSDLPVRENR